MAPPAERTAGGITVNNSSQPVTVERGIAAHLQVPRRTIDIWVGNNLHSKAGNNSLVERGIVRQTCACIVRHWNVLTNNSLVGLTNNSLVKWGVLLTLPEVSAIKPCTNVCLGLAILGNNLVQSWE